MTPPPLTPNQIVAINLRVARTLKGWTQEEAADHLAPYLGERWSKASWSVAERSAAHSDRIKQFTADDLAALAAAFDLPISFFFHPPSGPERIAPPAATKTLTAEQLSELAPGARDDERVDRLAEAAKADLQAKLDQMNETLARPLRKPSIERKDQK